jgi:PAP2 superfamily
VAVYGVYEISRGLFAGNAPAAIRHARDVAILERSVHLFIERDLQRWAHSIGGMLGLFGVLYLTLHLAVTGAYLLWLYRHKPNAYATVRATLLVATLISLVIFALYPTAPPRVAVAGIADAVSDAHFNLNHGLVRSLYNPFAAMPSMHFGYAVIVGASLARGTGRLVAPLVGLLYPALVLLIILTTGNHFLFDAIAGALVAGVAALMAGPITRLRWATPKSLARGVNASASPLAGSTPAASS